MNRGIHCLWVLFAGSMLFLATAWAASPEPDEHEFTELEALIADTSDLSEQEASQLTDQLQLARRQLTSLQLRRDRIDTYREIAEGYDEAIASLQSEIQTQMQPPSTETFIPENESELASATAALEALVRQLSQELFESRESEAKLSERASQIAAEMTQASAQVNDFSPVSSRNEEVWRQSVGVDATATTASVRKLVSRVKSHVALELINLLQLELTTLAPRQTLASLQSRALRIRLDAAIAQLDRHWVSLTQSRLTAVRAEIDELTDEITGRATGNSDIMNLLRTRVYLIEQELPILQRTTTISQSLLDIYHIRLVLARVTNTGAVNDSLAVTVRTLREELPDSDSLDKELEVLRKRMQQLQVNQILWETNLRDSQPQNALIGAIQPEFGMSESDEMLEHQTALLNVANRLAERMITLEAALLEAGARASQVRTILDGSILWLRTNETIGLEWLRYTYSALQWMLNLDTWRGVDVALYDAIQRKTVSLIFLSACLMGLVSMRRRMKLSLRQNADRVGNVGEDDYWITPLAFLSCLVLALPLPWLLMSAYWAVKDVFVFSGSVFPSLSASLLATSAALLIFLFFKALCRPESVFHRHFAWSKRAVGRLHAHLNWFVWVLAACTAIYTFAIASGRSDLRYALGMTAFLLVSLAMSAMLYTVFHPSRGIAFELENPKSRSAFTRLGWWVLISQPALLGLLPLLGYFDTAVAIQRRVFLTGVVLMATIILVETVKREFMVAHRRMSLRKARARRSALEAERSVQEATPASGDATPDLSFAWDDDYKRTAEEARQLFNLAGIALFLLGVWTVWKPMFPVLDNFNDIVLWQSAVTVDGTAVTDPVTLGKILFAATLLLIGVLAARNLRGVLELLFFERLKLDTGTRYAINAISSYVLLGSALLIAIAQLGVDWSRLQWIVAALGVGLGFGLQEIVANFISGIIILFERPVRVGDTVTIGGISGTVSNIQIRATTLTDFDNREVILPNKSIITDNVTNWTLHDSVTRILLSIGVAYGSDVEQVRQLLMECVKSVEHVLATPEPTVFFVNHGDSSLLFEIRVFVATPAYRLPVTHAISAAINEKLAAQGIEIPYPQRVVHMVSPSE